MTTAISYLDGPRLAQALNAGFLHVFQQRDQINRINVFPVPDGDTGTNLVFTFRAIQDALRGWASPRVDELMRRVADAALDGARGNSGAIMAQYFEGFRAAIEGRRLLNGDALAAASSAGSEAAWGAMSEPVEGTLPSVLSAFSDGLAAVPNGAEDIRQRLKSGLQAAQAALAKTPDQLPVLKSAGVVDAGGQGFVDLLEGIWTFVTHGRLDEDPGEAGEETSATHLGDLDVGAHRFCTECVIEGTGLDHAVVMRRLEALDSSSLVVAGSPRRIRVHIHVNNPAEVFLACGEFGEITRQKADDMQRQHGLINQPGVVAIVTDSGADFPEREAERVGLHVVPVRLSFGAQEYLDGVSIQPEEFYRMLDSEPVMPKTSQPPAQDFRRTYTLLASHGYDVLSVGLSAQLSGTTGAARSAASRTEEGRVEVFDTYSASCAQGLMALAAAEAAADGLTLEEIMSLLEELRPASRIFAVADDLGAAVRGGRVPKWMERATR